MIKKDLTKEEAEFLRESNAIERVYDEVAFLQAKYAWEFLRGRKKLTIGNILKTHKILMLHQPLQPDQKGYFRKCEVMIGGRYGLNWVKVPAAMEAWVETMNLPIGASNTSSEYLEETCKQFHVQYEDIHPFADGNGRTGRMFMNWQRLQLGLPILIIHEGQEQHEYYQWFKK